MDRFAPLSTSVSNITFLAPILSSFRTSERTVDGEVAQLHPLPVRALTIPLGMHRARQTIIKMRFMPRSSLRSIFPFYFLFALANDHAGSRPRAVVGRVAKLHLLLPYALNIFLGIPREHIKREIEASARLPYGRCSSEKRHFEAGPPSGGNPRGGDASPASSTRAASSSSFSHSALSFHARFLRRPTVLPPRCAAFRFPVRRSTAVVFSCKLVPMNNK